MQSFKTNAVKKEASPTKLPNTQPKLAAKPIEKASPVKVPENQILHTPDVKAKKPKPVMKDAETQTERSDVQVMKAKALREAQESSLRQLNQSVKRTSVSNLGF